MTVRAWGSTQGSSTAVVSPTDVPGVVSQGFSIGSAFNANVSPTAVAVGSSFKIGGVMGLLLLIAALWVLDRWF